MSMSEAEARAEGRREAAPAAFVVLVIFVMLGVVSKQGKWELIGFPWWVWLIVASPAFLLTVDLVLARRGRGLVQSRHAALLLLGVLILSDLVALVILVTGLVTTNTSELTGGELLLTGFAIWATDVAVFGILFWEVEAGGPVARLRARERTDRDFQFPQDENPQLAPTGWRPQAWDYLYVSLTNSIAFSPTDTMPLSRRAKALMGLESAISAVTLLLVASRAVNVLGS
jgi:uncharacterized membrane protein